MWHQRLVWKEHFYLANRSSSSRKKIAESLSSVCRIVELEQWPLQPESIDKVDIVVNCTSIGFETLKQDEKGTYSLKSYSPLGSVDDKLRVSPGDNAEEEFLSLAKADIESNQSQSQEILKALNQPFVFDIIYQPLETTLMNLAQSTGSQTLNGLSMNLEQAVIAFQKAASSSGLYSGESDQIRSIMQASR